MKVLSTIINKFVIQEELSDDEAIDLLILPDMDINIPIKALMKVICFLITNSNIPDQNFKEEIILCEIMVLKRFFEGDELLEMVDMLRYGCESPERMDIIDKYGPGFDLIYFDGKAEGIAEGIAEGKLEDASNLLARGVDEEIISDCTGISIDKLKELKRKL